MTTYFSVGHDSGVNAGSVCLRLKDFDRQSTVSLQEIADALRILPDRHLAGLRFLVYDPDHRLALFRVCHGSGHLARRWGAYYMRRCRAIVFHGVGTRRAFLETLYHEIGHYVFHRILGGVNRKRWITQLNHAEGHVSDYAGRNGNEDFAESYSAYMTNPRLLREFPQKYAFMRDTVFAGMQPERNDLWRRSPAA